MPTYQYACTECGHGFEQYQAFSEEALSICPECGGRLRKVFNSVGVTFKGSGFYRTDSRSDALGSAAAADSSPAGSDGSAATATAGTSAKTGPAQASPARATPAGTSGASSGSSD